MNTGGSGRNGWHPAPVGSVRAARERVEAGLPTEQQASRPFANAIQSGSPTISRPTPMPQWPLIGAPATREVTHSGSSPNGSNNQKGSPPRRPPRPSYVHSILDSSKIQDHTPTFEYRPERPQGDSQTQAHYEEYEPQYQPKQPKQQTQRYWEENYSPDEPSNNASGLTGTSGSSRLSTTSSTYDEIPDFPIPDVPAVIPNQLQPSLQPRKIIGPPPTSRRGASSYYSQSSYVAPIPEEDMPGNSRKPQHGSFASSHVMPREWETEPPNFGTGYTEDDEYEDDYVENRKLTDSGGDHDESTTLVRKASLGRQYKPSLTTVRSSISSSIDVTESMPKLPGPISQAAKGLGSNTTAASSHRNLLAGTPFVDQPDAEVYSSEASSSRADPRIQAILGGLERGGAIEKGMTPPSLDRSTKPLKLDIDAVHKAEARGSLTSLSDLIKRATKAKSNLDKGRTASRLGMLDMFGGSNPNLLERARAANAADRSNSLTGMLGSFPQPSGTPRNDRPDSRWPSPFANSNLNIDQYSQDLNEKEVEKPIRKCCGMPLWIFVVLLIALLLIVAAAVVVPVVLIVLPKQGTTQGVDLSKCFTASPCSNGGSSVVSADSCRCVCSNGFTGSSCTVAADGECTSTNIGAFKNATMGSTIPRLFTGASSNFSIPLNATSLLSAFSHANISCSDEEALVSFNSKNERRFVANEDLTPTMALAPRDPTTPSNAAITSNGVVLAPGDGETSTAATVTGSAASATSTADTGKSPDQNDLDFARVATLWIMQETNLNIATTAQQMLKTNLVTDQFTATTVDVGNGVQVDFLKQTVSYNGTTVGG